MKRITICLVGFAIAGSAVGQDVTLRINPGLWENTANIAVEMSMGGETMTIPAQVKTDQECVSDEDTTLDLSDFAQDGCSVTSVTQSGSTVTAVLACDTNGIQFNGNMTTTVADDGNSANTTIAANGSGPMGPVSMSGTVTGTRIGGC